MSAQPDHISGAVLTINTGASMSMLLPVDGRCSKFSSGDWQSLPGDYLLQKARGIKSITIADQRHLLRRRQLATAPVPGGIFRRAPVII
jgi:hypothetical protein